MLYWLQHNPSHPSCIFCITLHRALTSLRACQRKLIRAESCPGIQTSHLGGGGVFVPLTAHSSTAMRADLGHWSKKLGSNPDSATYYLGNFGQTTSPSEKSILGGHQSETHKGVGRVLCVSVSITPATMSNTYSTLNTYLRT